MDAWFPRGFQWSRTQHAVLQHVLPGHGAPATSSSVSAHSVLLQGCSGTGKTTTLLGLRKRWRDAGLPPDGVVLLCPTGAAATATGGVTWHHWFMLPSQGVLPSSPQEAAQHLEANPRLRERLGAVRLLLCDDVHLLAGRVWECAALLCAAARSEHAADADVAPSAWGTPGVRIVAAHDDRAALPWLPVAQRVTQAPAFASLPWHCFSFKRLVLWRQLPRDRAALRQAYADALRPCADAAVPKGVNTLGQPAPEAGAEAEAEAEVHGVQHLARRIARHYHTLASGGAKRAVAAVALVFSNAVGLNASVTAAWLAMNTAHPLSFQAPAKAPAMTCLALLHGTHVAPQVGMVVTTIRPVHGVATGRRGMVTSITSGMLHVHFPALGAAAAEDLHLDCPTADTMPRGDPSGMAALPEGVMTLPLAPGWVSTPFRTSGLRFQSVMVADPTMPLYHALSRCAAGVASLQLLATASSIGCQDPSSRTAGVASRRGAAHAAGDVAALCGHPCVRTRGASSEAKRRRVAGVPRPGRPGGLD